MSPDVVTRREVLGTASMLVVAGLLPAGRAAPCMEGEGEPAAKLGVYYFDGWTGQTYHITERLRTEFAEREPEWGWRDDSLEVMGRQIDLAADHGLGFFAFDWYWPEGSEKETPLNHALGLYLKAGNRARMEFCLLVANHAGFRIGPGDWDAVCERWVALLREPTHVKLNGKPLLIFFSAGELLKAFGDAGGVKQAFEKLRERARAAGLDGVTIAACATPGPEHGWNDLKELEAAGFDLFTGYNYAGAGRKGPEPGRPFGELVKGSEAIWDSFAAKTSLPYMPVVTAGFDKRPWEERDTPRERQAVYYEGRTPQVIGDFVSRAIGWMDRHPAHTTQERVVLIYAWNENGEGGYLTPTKSEGPAVLEAVAAALRGK